MKFNLLNPRPPPSPPSSSSSKMKIGSILSTSSELQAQVSASLSWSLRDFLNHRTATVMDFRPNLRFYAIVYEKILEQMQSPGPRKT